MSFFHVLSHAVELSLYGEGHKMADILLLDHTNDFSFYWSPSTLMREYMNVFLLCSSLILLQSSVVFDIGNIT